MVLLGDRVAEALAAVGVTPAVVSAWLGGPCSCDERRQKLNSLDLWTRRVLRGKLQGSKRHLLDLISTHR